MAAKDESFLALGLLPVIAPFPATEVRFRVILRTLLVEQLNSTTQSIFGERLLGQKHVGGIGVAACAERFPFGTEAFSVYAHRRKRPAHAEGEEKDEGKND